MIFILGIERSATTWLSNLIDAHPSTNVFVEPMSDFTARFKKWPDRFEQIEDLEQRANYFLSEMDIIRKHKKWLFTQWSQSKNAWQFDLWLSNYLVRKGIAGESARDFSEINFHRKGEAPITKDRVLTTEVIKELRLNFNARLIPHLGSGNKVLVSVRDFAANIQSIIKQIKQGNLSELHSLLLNYYGSVDEKTAYRYWLESYNTLIGDLEEADIPHIIANHNELLKNPEHTIEQLSDFIGLEHPQAILDYLRSTDTSGQGLHNTNRQHSKLLEQSRLAREEILPKLEGIFEIDELHPELRKIVESLDKI